MQTPSIHVGADDRPDLDAILEARIHDGNARATGIYDGTSLNASVVDDAGQLVAGVSGHSWGGCCTIMLLWVDESIRGGGVGRALMQAAEGEARRRGCHQIVLSTHNFQAPRFYEKLGFRPLAVIPNNPAGYEDIIYIKELRKE
jgi:GNAT superfamily N-acetyltransferase